MKKLIQAMAAAIPLLLYGCIGTLPRNPDVAALPILDDDQRAVLAGWLARHPDLRPAKESDCDCDEDIREMRRSGPFGRPVPNYEPYILVGDLNGDGKPDLAVMLIKTERDGHTDGVLVIFNGPFTGANKSAAFEKDVGAIDHVGLFRREDAGRLLVGPFFSEGCEYLPKGSGYKEDCDED